MTQPAPTAPVQPPPSLEDQLRFQQHVTKVAEAVTMVVRNVDPVVTSYALTSVLVTAVQATPITRQELIDLVAQGFDRTLAAMAMLGVAPGQPPPPDFADRVKKMIADAQAAAQADQERQQASGG